MATKDENERLAVLETKVTTVQNDVAEIKTDVKGLVESIDKKYASKWVERVVAGLIGIILTAFLGVLVAVVFSKPDTSATITRTTTVTVNPNGTTTKEVSDSNGDHSKTTTPSAPNEQPGTSTTTEEQAPAQSPGLLGGLLSGFGL